MEEPKLLSEVHVSFIMRVYEGCGMIDIDNCTFENINEDTGEMDINACTRHLEGIARFETRTRHWRE